jgi:tetratricopeptide (TPR) repeat protein
MAHALKAIKHCEETQLLVILGSSWQALGWGYLLQGDLGAAREHVVKGHDHDRTVGFSLISSYYYELMSDICLESGDWGSAQAYAEEGLQLAKTHGDTLYEGTLSMLLGAALAKADPLRAGRGEELILDGIKILDDLKIRPFSARSNLHLGQFYADTGRRQEAPEALNNAHDAFREMGMDYWLARTQKALERLNAQ